MELFGLLILNSVLVAVVTNYFTQCEMILFYVKGITVRLQEKSTDLKTAMKVNHLYNCKRFPLSQHFPLEMKFQSSSDFFLCVSGSKV